jgi:hypothetical protein
MRELGSYTDRELASDLRLSQSDIPWVAMEEAERRLGLFVRRHPEFRAAWDHHGHAGLAFG